MLWHSIYSYCPHIWSLPIGCWLNHSSMYWNLHLVTQETFHQDFLESECFSVSKNMEKCYLYIWESFWESFSRMNHNMLIIVATTRIERVDMSYRVCSIYFTTLSCYHEQYVMSSEYIINIYDLARIYFFRKDNYYENAHTFICSWPTYH